MWLVSRTPVFLQSQCASLDAAAATQAHAIHELVHTCLVAKVFPGVSKRKQVPAPCPVCKQRLCGLGRPSHWLTVAWGGKDTHAPLFLSGETSQLQARKQILNTYVYKYTHTHKKTIHTHSLLSSRVNKTFLVYSGTFCTLQNHHKKPQPHLDTSPWSI